MELYQFESGSAPLLVSMPHVGTYIPPELADRMTGKARSVPDTDWHVDRLYDFLDEMGANIVQATHSRYVIDLNRPPDGQLLYPGASNTELCPTSLFDGDPIYGSRRAPDEAEVADRLANYWRPYHDRLSMELAALKR
ncbi:MAG: N-formylglutamate amidohydrolase, partial [Dongiaceae bacterium]